MIFDLYALGFAAVCAGVVLVALAVIDRPSAVSAVPRPYDWATDGECNNTSKPRLVAQYKGDRR